MAGYTVQNLREVENSAEKFGLAPDIDARFARRSLEAESSGVSLQRLGPNVRTPFGHRHREQEETYVVVGGIGRVKLDDDVVDVEPWDAVRVSPGTMRCFEAGSEGLELLAFGAGAAGDVDMVPGWWTD